MPLLGLPNELLTEIMFYILAEMLGPDTHETFLANFLPMLQVNQLLRDIGKYLLEQKLDVITVILIGKEDELLNRFSKESIKALQQITKGVQHLFPRPTLTLKCWLRVFEADSNGIVDITTLAFFFSQTNMRRLTFELASCGSFIRFLDMKYKYLDMNYNQRYRNGYKSDVLKFISPLTVFVRRVGLITNNLTWPREANRKVTRMSSLLSSLSDETKHISEIYEYIQSNAQIFPPRFFERLCGMALNFIQKYRPSRFAPLHETSAMSTARRDWIFFRSRIFLLMIKSICKRDRSPYNCHCTIAGYWKCAVETIPLELFAPLFLNGKNLLEAHLYAAYAQFSIATDIAGKDGSEEFVSSLMELACEHAANAHALDLGNAEATELWLLVHNRAGKVPTLGDLEEVRDENNVVVWFGTVWAHLFWQRKYVWDKHHIAIFQMRSYE